MQSDSWRPGSGGDCYGYGDRSALSGICDGDAANDLTLQDGSVVSAAEDPAPFLDSWQVPSSLTSVGQTRFRPDSCATADCSPCLRMVSNRTFSACHRFVCVNWVCHGGTPGLGMAGTCQHRDQCLVQGGISLGELPEVLSLGPDWEPAEAWCPLGRAGRGWALECGAAG